MAIPNEIKGRYEVHEILGQGGMGVVYQAFDKVVKRKVALKTIRDAPSRAALDLFQKECDILAQISHPNIIEIFDIGEFEEDGTAKPYFVMPLLPGRTLEDLIRTSKGRLTVQRSIEIICQTCRGLQAAHDRGLIHRDLKPSNIFVMDDDSVKVIDFGIAHMVETHSTMGQKGTLLYMAPEQVEMKPVSALTDIFALGVVCFETLSMRHPFEGGNAEDVASAIRKHIPPPVSELNPSVNGMISRVTHKAMAKQPWYRFSSAREMAEALQKAVRNEPIEIFDSTRIQPRVERAGRAFEQGDHQFANEILSELEAEGYVDTSITALRRQIDRSQRERLIAQLLESARTRAEEEEYPLAFQKLQELLSLDPSNGAALSLKSSIEKRRSERKVEDWLRLARQHMDQSAFDLARQALKNVLEINRADSRALHLTSEIDQREQEFLRARHEKEQLYNKAVNAWQNGEVSAALSKLERLVEIDQRLPDPGASERSASFHSFYNQVRSEHDAIKSCYEQARKHLVDRNFSGALDLCSEQLRRHPGQALFQALKLEIEERQRQELSSCIAETDRQIEAEPDLDKRVDILSDALKLHPGEPHFERALRMMRDKRDLVNSIVGKAQAQEERQQFADALGQWEILKTIYSQYPGLDFEVERVRRRHDQQVRGEAKMKWVEQIDWQLSVNEFDRARDLLLKASVEFPNDAELAELEKLASQGIASVAQAQRLLAEGQRMVSEGCVEEATGLLRQARNLDSHSEVIRAALISALVEQARSELEHSWQAADDLAQQALELDPTDPQVRSVKSLILDRRREEYVNECVAQARRYQADGMIEAALGRVRQGLEEFPLETRLNQLYNTLNRAGDRGRSPSAEAVETVFMGPTEPVQARIPATGAQSEAAPLPASSAAAADTAMAQEASSSHAETAATRLPEPARPARDAAPPVELPPPVSDPISPQGPEVLRPASRPAASKKIPFLLLGAAVVVAAIIGSVSVFHRKPKPAAPPVTIAPIAPPVVAAAELPPTTLRIAADLEGGKVTFDDGSAQDLQDAQISLENISPGKHVLKINGAHEEGTIQFEAADGAAPTVTSLTAREAIVVAVANKGGAGRVQTSTAAAKITLDGQPVGETSATGLDLNGLAAGNHELAVGDGKDLRSIVVGIAAAPMLSVFLKSDRNIGTMVVVTGEDGVRVFLNGKEYRRQTQRGLLRIPNLEVKGYSVRIVKDGFLEVPEQQASIRKGAEVKLEFKLQPIPKVASLSIQGATAGATVFLDQNSIGEVQDDGTFTASSVPPGDHTIELRKDTYRPRKMDRHFEAGAAIQLGAADTALEKALSTLVLHVTPPGARVTINRSGETPKPVTESTISVPDGSYTLTGRASNYAERSVTISISAGETKSVDLVLPKMDAPKPLGMSDWDEPAAWIEERGWFVHKGGNFVGFKPPQVVGTLVFVIDLRKGKRLQWVARYSDPKNYLLFQMDKKVFYRVQVVDGKETVLEKKPYPTQKQSTYRIAVDISAGAIVNKLYDGSKWMVLDNWEESGRSFSRGKFGFMLPGSDSVAISDFSFSPK
jgi:serine/threonine-protein kinase